MRRLVALISIATLVTLGVAGPVSADTSTLSAGVIFSGQSIAGGPFAPTATCYTGRGLTGGLQTLEARCAFEFDISGIPAGSTITSATLSTTVIPVGAGCTSSFPCATDFLGYAGNGVGEVGDLTAGTLLFTHTPLVVVAYEHHDVTAFVSATFAAGGDWAGFLLSPNGSAFNGPADWNSAAGGPILSIEYTVPAATNLPDAAMAAPAATSPIGLLGFGLLLAAALGSVAVLSARRSR